MRPPAPKRAKQIAAAWIVLWVGILGYVTWPQGAIVAGVVLLMLSLAVALFTLVDSLD